MGVVAWILMFWDKIIKLCAKFIHVPGFFTNSERYKSSKVKTFGNDSNKSKLQSQGNYEHNKFREYLLVFVFLAAI
jgi:hypothetical protein